MERGVTVIARGRTYANGPETFCDNADVHPQPCVCAAPKMDMRAMAAPDTGSIGTYWPIEDADPVQPEGSGNG
jgi:hypothetical protein